MRISDTQSYLTMFLQTQISDERGNTEATSGLADVDRVNRNSLMMSGTIPNLPGPPNPVTTHS